MPRPCPGSSYSPCETQVGRSIGSLWVTWVTYGAIDEPELFLAQKQKKNNVLVFNSPTGVGGLLKAPPIWRPLLISSTPVPVLQLCSLVLLGVPLHRLSLPSPFKGLEQAYSCFLLLVSALPFLLGWHKPGCLEKSSSLLALGTSQVQMLPAPPTFFTVLPVASPTAQPLIFPSLPSVLVLLSSGLHRLVTCTRV